MEAVRKNVEGRRASARAASVPAGAGSSGGGEQGSGHAGSAAWTSPNGSAGMSPMKFAALKQAAQEFQRHVRPEVDSDPTLNPHPVPQLLLMLDHLDDHHTIPD